MRPDRWHDHVARGRRSTVQIFEDALQGKARFIFEEALVTGVVTWTGFTDLTRLHLLPAAVELLRIEDRIHELRAPVIFQILDSALAPQFKEYDYVLLDCPPNLDTQQKPRFSLPIAASSRTSLIISRFLVSRCWQNKLARCARSSLPTSRGAGNPILAP